MAFRSPRNPVLVALGAGVVIGCCATIPLAASAGESPSPSPTHTPTSGDTPPSKTPQSEPTPTDKPSGGDTSPPPTPTPPTPTPTPPPSSTPPTSPTPSPPTTPPPTTPPTQGVPAGELHVSLALSATTAAPGGSLNATVSVHSGSVPIHGAQLQITGSGLTVSPASSVLGDVTSGGRVASATIIVSGSTAPGFYTVTAAVWGEGGASGTAQVTVNVTPRTEGAPAGGQNPAALPPPQAPLTNGDSSHLSLPQINPPAVAPAQNIGTPPFTSLRDGKVAFSDGLHIRSIAAVQGGWLAVLLLGNGLLILRLWMFRRPAVAPVRFVAPNRAAIPRPTDVAKPEPTARPIDVVEPEPIAQPIDVVEPESAGQLTDVLEPVGSDIAAPEPVLPVDSPYAVPDVMADPYTVPPIRKALHSLGLAHKRGSHRRTAKNPVIAAVADPQSEAADEPVSASVRDGRMTGTGQYGPDWNGSLAAALRLLEG